MLMKEAFLCEMMGSLPPRGHLHLTATHEEGGPAKFRATASTDSEVRQKMKSVLNHPEGGKMRISVENKKTGEVWSGKSHHQFPGF